MISCSDLWLMSCRTNAHCVHSQYIQCTIEQAMYVWEWRKRQRNQKVKPGYCRAAQDVLFIMGRGSVARGEREREREIERVWDALGMINTTEQNCCFLWTNINKQETTTRHFLLMASCVAGMKDKKERKAAEKEALNQNLFLADMFVASLNTRFKRSTRMGEGG